MLKKVGVILLALLLILGTAVADTAPALYIQRVTPAGEGMVDVSFHSAVTHNLNPEDVSVVLGGEAQETVSIDSYSKSNSGTTYLLLVDVPERLSAGTEETMIKNVQVIARALQSQLQANDNMGVFALGSDIASIRLNRDLDALDKAIANIKANQESKLNVGISNALAFLGASTEIKGRVSLLVFSTGGKRDETGKTIEEIKTEITTAGIPLYTFALPVNLNDNSTGKKDDLNTFGSLARVSRGGKEFAITKTVDAKALGDQFMQAQQQFYTARVAITKSPASYNSILITLVDGTMRLEDNRDLTTAEIAALQAAASSVKPEETTVEPETTEAAEPAPENTDVPAPSDAPMASPTEAPAGLLQDGMLLWVVLGAAALLVLVLLIVLVSKGGKRSKKASEAPVYGDVSRYQEATMPTEPIRNYTPQPAGARLSVVLTPVGGSGNDRYTAGINDALIIGRSPSQAKLVIKDDPKVSGMHAKLTYDGRTLRIEDMKSTNGTKVNGAQVSVPTVLNEGDVITMGKTSLRITWKQA
ncbi:MAG: FHA domain-containing protein [Candidatus Limiplasma sp.]|nr:FHA domain-containing protein [Candidatus Limiplasma sp.]